MKKLITLAASVVLGAGLTYAQNDVQSAAAKAAEALSQAQEQTKVIDKPQYWFTSADLALGFNQTGLFSWAAGGYSTLSLATGADLKANYAKNLSSWNNRLQLDYGFLWSADKANLLQKSKDRIYLESKWTHKTSNESKWRYTAEFDFRTQFTDSYDSYTQNEETKKWEGKLKSSLLAPANITVSLGMDWEPTDWFNVTLSPLTGGIVICTVPELRKAYGMKVNTNNDEPYGTVFHSTLFQIGAQIKTNFKVSINDKFKYETQLVLFTDYLDKPFVNNRVNWDNKIRWQVAKHIAIGFDTWLIYDPIVLIDGKNKVQFKEFLTVDFNLGFSNKR